jgi:hypothetical protein
LILFVALDNVSASDWRRSVGLALQIAVDEVATDFDPAGILKHLHIAADLVTTDD